MPISGHVGAVYIQTADPPEAFIKEPTQADALLTLPAVIGIKTPRCLSMSMIH